MGDLQGCAALTLAGMLWGGAFRRRSYGHARVRFGQTRVVAALQPEGLYALCAGARRYHLRGWATLTHAQVRDATACADGRRCRLRECATLPLARVRDAVACADARRCRLRECATLPLARVRDAVACAGARRCRLRECFGRDAFVVVRTCTLACALSRRALLLTARWLYAPWGEFATLPHARMRDAAACADGRCYRMRGCAVLPLARVRDAAACASARR